MGYSEKQKTLFQKWFARQRFVTGSLENFH